MIVKPKCTRGVVYQLNGAVHDAYMQPPTRLRKKKADAAQKTVKSRLKPPLYQRNKIMELREEKELTQQQLADLVGEYFQARGILKGSYTHTSINRIENRTQNITQPVGDAIANALGVTREELITGRKPSAEIQRLVEGVEPARQILLMEMIRGAVQAGKK